MVAQRKPLPEHPRGPARKDFQSRLPLLDNQALQFPFVMMRHIGCPLEKEAFGLTQLNMIYDQGEDRDLCQGSILEVTSPARAEFFSYFPMPAGDNIRLIKYLLPALAIMQLFLPASPQNAASVSLQSSGDISIQGRAAADMNAALTRDIISGLRSLGG